MQEINDIVVLEEAADDLVTARNFYEKQVQGLGQYYWDGLISDIESLVLYAGAHERHFGLFRMLSRRFPYAIYYEISETIAYVIAVLPMRRNPAWIREELARR